MLLGWVRVLQQHSPSMECAGSLSTATPNSTAVTAAAGYLCLPIRCFLPQNTQKGQRPSHIPAAVMKLYVLILHVQIFWFCRFRAPCSWQSQSQPCWGASVLTTATTHHICSRRLQTSFKDSSFILTIATQLLLARHAKCLIENRARFTLCLDAGEDKPGQMDLRKWALEKMLEIPQLPAGASICLGPG